MSSPSKDAEKEAVRKKALVVDTASPDPKGNVAGSSPVPALTLSSTLSSQSTPKTPANQSIQVMTPEVREQLARNFITTKFQDENDAITFDDLCDQGKLRAKRLMTKDFNWSPSVDTEKKGHGETTFKEQFELLCNVHKDWEDLSRVFFEEAAMDDFLVIRRQRAGICFMHAVTVYQHYVVYLRVHRRGSNHEVLDLSWYIRERFPQKKLKRFLVNGGGGSALEFWCELTGDDLGDVSNISIDLVPKSISEIRFHVRINEVCQLYEVMKEPALVAGFAIEKDFQTPGIYKYDCEPDAQNFIQYGIECGKKSGGRVLHSMVMLGLWRDNDDQGKVWFLLQNFWATKYLVMVSGEYLSSCRAKIFFAPKTTNVALVKQMHVIDAQYSETETSPEEEEETCPEEN